MAKKRIHQIAKELDLASADILHQAKELGITIIGESDWYNLINF